jgi:hypothetical protein
VKKRASTGRFEKFVAAQADPKLLLPLVHTISAYRFADLCDSDNIEPRHCKHFGEDLVYLFYGRPAYRTEKAEFTDLSFNWPVVFILDNAEVSGISSIYPFDSGAFFLRLYARFFSQDSEIQDFRVSGELGNAGKIVSAFYKNEFEYLEGRTTKNPSHSPFDFEVEGVNRLCREPSYTQRISEDRITRDERSTSIEVQSREPISIERAVRRIIFPQKFLNYPDTIKALERWKIDRTKVTYYEVFSYHEPQAFMSQIYRLVIDSYVEMGLIARE